jgi:hypothetical protein
MESDSLEMTVQKITNAILYGVAADTKPTNYADNTLFFVQDTGEIYRSTSGAWSIIAGASKTETLTNKTISARDNDLKFTEQTYMNLNSKRVGVGYAANGGNHLLGSLGNVTITGTYAVIAYNTTDGLIGSQYTTAASSGAKGSFQNPLSTKWGDNPRIKLMCSVDSTATGNFHCGWSTNATFPTSSTTPYGNTEKGISFGYLSGGTNFSIFHNDGSGAFVTDAMSTPVAKTAATTKFTVEIICSASSAQVIYNDTNSTTISSRLPSSTDSLAFFCGVITSSTTARAWKFYGAHGENI